MKTPLEYALELLSEGTGRRGRHLRSALLTSPTLRRSHDDLLNTVARFKYSTRVLKNKGTTNGYLLDDPREGTTWLVKPSIWAPNEEAASRLHRALGSMGPDVRALTVPAGHPAFKLLGGFGQGSFKASIQKIMPGDTVGLTPLHQLTKEQQVQAFINDGASYVAGDRDVHGNNIFLTRGGQLYGIDRGRAFDYRPTWSGTTLSKAGGRYVRGHIFGDPATKMVPTYVQNVDDETLDHVEHHVMAWANHAASVPDEHIAHAVRGARGAFASWGGKPPEVDIAAWANRRKAQLPQRMARIFGSIREMRRTGQMVPFPL